MASLKVRLRRFAGRLIRSIRYCWAYFTRRTQIDDVIFVASRRDLPKDLDASLFVVGTNPVRWAVLNCPCGCGQRANLKLGLATRTSWSLTVSVGLASLAPSVLIPGDGCGSHFFIRSNRIIWVRD